MANVDNTNFWLSPYLQPQSPISVLKPVKKKKTTKSGRPSGSVNFPIDFFEHCLQSNDIEVRCVSNFETANYAPFSIIFSNT